ncbi:hypothetical protein ACFQ1I_45040 [Kitasatospora arboriphila]
MARAGRPHLALLGALLASTDAAGIRTVQSGVFPESTAGLALHARAASGSSAPASASAVGTAEARRRPAGAPQPGRRLAAAAAADPGRVSRTGPIHWRCEGE